MLIDLDRSATDENVRDIVAAVQGMDLKAEVLPGGHRTAIGILGNTGYVNGDALIHLPGVKELIHVSKPYKLVSREWNPEDTIVDVDGIKIGGGNFVMIAGPCSVESEEQIMEAARAVKAAGANMLRGGAFKPRTGPYSFQGLGEEGLKFLRKAKEETGLPVVTELLHAGHIDLLVEYADVIQLGARNMQNFELLKLVGRTKKPILLKRGPSAMFEEFLLAAEYILNEGNPNVILCERGIRTFEKATRNTLDLNIVPLAKQLSHLPIIVDPSHGTGVYSLVKPLSKAAKAVGADGIMVEMHPNPTEALSDGKQSLNAEDFEDLMKELNQMKI